ncbi:MAG: hydrogenase maturation protease [Saprospiraceae bacterium]|nr:hydrogenase maturation protease [Saprospiraceae bacterium]
MKGTSDKTNLRPLLLLAIGNDARQDDGLGWAYARALEAQGRFDGAVEYRYQLQIEDADLIAAYDTVVFADASKTALSEGYAFTRLTPALEFAFSTHALSPAAVLALCETVYGRCPEAWLLTIGGEAWELAFGLSEAGERNLAAALAAQPF